MCKYMHMYVCMYVCMCAYMQSYANHYLHVGMRLARKRRATTKPTRIEGGILHLGGLALVQKSYDTHKLDVAQGLIKYLQ